MCNKTSDFDYNLPDNLIAIEPPKLRGSSRLLVINKKDNKVTDKYYGDIIDYLQKDDVLVLNDSKVIKARLIAKKENGAERELFILEKHGKIDDWQTHKVLYKRCLKANDKLYVGKNLISVIKVLDNGTAIVKSELDLLLLAEKYGQVPLPPYLHREANIDDESRYQTVWANQPGSVAAPTASLNMTKKLLENLEHKGVIVVNLTLHVGLGTFIPIRTENLKDHTMHVEYFVLPKATVKAIRNAKNSGKKVVALGTTVARTLEYTADKLINNKPKDYTGEANIFIYPGYSFKLVDVLITNFHAPKSTVLMLTAAFTGKELLMRAYEHAKLSDYKFLSYGDSMLIK